MTRRDLLRQSAALSAWGFITTPGQGQATPPGRMGLVAYCFGLRRTLDPKSRLDDPLVFLEQARTVGAGGIQMSLGIREEALAKKLRSVAEKNQMYIEGIIRLPRDKADVERFSAEVRTARQCGAAVVRTTLMDGRRYEVFDKGETFRQFAERGQNSLRLAQPIVERDKIGLAVENHKDLRSDELLELLNRCKSPNIGACVDTGNNIALLESPQATVAALAPHAVSVHLKDMAVAEYPAGFHLSEVPLGTGFLDLPRIVDTLRKARPGIRFNLEMLTRDPLPVPCLTPRYWATLEHVSGRHLAETLTLVRTRAGKDPLPQISTLKREEKIKREADNVARCLRYARQRLVL